MPKAKTPVGPPTAPPVQMDEDATEIADGPPPPPKDLIVVRAEPKRRPAEKPPEPARPRVENIEVVPRSRLVMRGTEGAAAIAAQAKIERLEEQMPTARHPALKPLRGRLSHEAISNLERALGGEFENRELGAAPHSPKRSLEKLINLSAFTELEAADRARLLAALAQDPREVETIRSAQRLASSAILPRLSPRDRTTLLDLFSLLSPSDRAALAALAARGLHRASFLEDRDFEDTILISHLHALASAKKLAPPIERLGIKSEDVVALVLATLATPERIALEEGANGVLSVLEFGLADASPSECARLWRGLVTQDAAADLPTEGTLELGKYLGSTDMGPSPGSVDTPLRMGFDLLARLARPKGGLDRSAFVMPGGHGIDADVLARALGYLYGVGFTVAAGSAAAWRHLERVHQDRYRVPPAFISLLYEGGERLFVFDHIEGGSVFFRAPHGTSTKPPGARRLEPDRQVEDPPQGLESVLTQSFKANVGVAIVPRT
jgi:hypothetical protein